MSFILRTWNPTDLYFLGLTFYFMGPIMQNKGRLGSEYD